MAGIDEQDSGVVAVGYGQRPTVGEPARPRKRCDQRVGPHQLGRTDPQPLRPCLGIAPDRPAIQATIASADKALSVGVKQERCRWGQTGRWASSRPVSASQRWTPLQIAGCHQLAVGTDIGRQSPGGPPAFRNGCRASRGGASDTLGPRPRPRRRPYRLERTPAGGRPARTRLGGYPAPPPAASPETASQSRVVPSQLEVASR